MNPIKNNIPFQMSDAVSAENAEVRQRRVPDSPAAEHLEAPRRDDVRPTSDESDMDAVLQDEDRCVGVQSTGTQRDKGYETRFTDVSF